jgi:hypothetical protein
MTAWANVATVSGVVVVMLLDDDPVVAELEGVVVVLLEPLDVVVELLLGVVVVLLVVVLEPVLLGVVVVELELVVLEPVLLGVVVVLLGEVVVPLDSVVVVELAELLTTVLPVVVVVVVVVFVLLSEPVLLEEPLECELLELTELPVLFELPVLLELPVLFDEPVEWELTELFELPVPFELFVDCELLDSFVLDMKEIVNEETVVLGKVLVTVDAFEVTPELAVPELWLVDFEVEPPSIFSGPSKLPSRDASGTIPESLLPHATAPVTPATVASTAVTRIMLFMKSLLPRTRYPTIKPVHRQSLVPRRGSIDDRILRRSRGAAACSRVVRGAAAPGAAGLRERRRVNGVDLGQHRRLGLHCVDHEPAANELVRKHREVGLDPSHVGLVQQRQARRDLSEPPPLLEPLPHARSHLVQREVVTVEKVEQDQLIVEPSRVHVTCRLEPRAHRPPRPA